MLLVSFVLISILVSYFANGLIVALSIFEIKNLRRRRISLRLKNRNLDFNLIKIPVPLLRDCDF